MTEERRRRRAVATPTQEGNKEPSSSNIFYSGDNIFKQADKIAESRQKRGPNRFKLSYKGQESKGGHFYPSKAQIILLDTDASSVAAYQEHEIWQTIAGKKRPSYEVCVAQEEVCPLCEHDKAPQYVMLLTALVLQPYDKKDGTEVPFQKQLLPVKSNQLEKFQNYLQLQGKGTWRGLKLNAVRGAEKNASRIGDLDFIEKLSEEELRAFVKGEVDRVIKDGTKFEFKDEAGQPIDTIKYFTTPFEYKKIITLKTADQLRTQYNIAALAGSRKEFDDTFSGFSDTSDVVSSNSDDDMDDEIPWE